MSTRLLYDVQRLALLGRVPPPQWVKDAQLYVTHNRALRVEDRARLLPISTKQAGSGSAAIEWLRHSGTRGSDQPPPDTEREFAELMAEWKNAVQFSSSHTQIVQH